jgi:hypothetical protein
MNSLSASVNNLPWIPMGLGVAVVLGFVIYWIVRKGRPMPGAHVFRASRWSRDNRIFPSQVAISETSVTMYHPQWIGKLEESIHMAHVASIKIDTNVVFSDVFIETTGGNNPIACHGHTKRDAVEMKRLIEQFQSVYYKNKG